MRTNILAMIGLIGLLLSACNVSDKTVEKSIIIAAETKPCSAGEMQKECLQIKWAKDQSDWELFYNDIEGFTYQNGFEYELLVSEEKVANAPADASGLKYKLIKEVSKKEVQTIAIPDGHNSQNALDWAGTYTGTLPCADCEGIQTTIVLNQDNTFTRTEEYLGKKGKPTSTKGNFIWNDGGNTITLVDGDRKQQYRVGENTLNHLDMEGNVISGQLADKYVLTKKQTTAATSGIEDKTWKLVNFMGKDISESESDYFIKFDSKEKRVNTKVGCNMMNSTYTITNELSLKFGPMMSTQMMCPEGSIEDEYSQQITTVDNFTTNGENLQLNRARMTVATYKLVN